MGLLLSSSSNDEAGRIGGQMEVSAGVTPLVVTDGVVLYTVVGGNVDVNLVILLGLDVIEFNWDSLMDLSLSGYGSFVTRRGPKACGVWPAEPCSPTMVPSLF